MLLRRGYLDRDVNPAIGNLNEPATPLLQPGADPARTSDSGNNIINVLRDLGTRRSRSTTRTAATSR